MMRVEQFQRADFVFAHHAGDAGEREFQFFRFRRGRQKQASLRRTRACRFGGQMNLHDGCAGRMRIQIQLQQFEKNFGVEHGQGQAQGAKKLLIVAC